jgi:hypothetical protein
VIVVLAAVVLVAVFAFVAFAVDTGLIAVTTTEMQNAVDAASLAASQEISGAVHEAGQGQGDATIDANSIAVSRARTMAAEVAALNGVYVDPNRDVQFGKRNYDESTDTWQIDWGAEPYNVVRVTARRTELDTSQPDGRVKLAFGWAVNKPSVPVQASATAFVEARDLALVLDFSASMNDDSALRAFGKLGQSAVEANMYEIYTELGPPDLGNMVFTPQWLTVVGQPPQDASQAQKMVTFKDTSALINSTKNITEVKLRFEDGDTQTFEGQLGQSCEVSGTGSNQGQSITTVWVTSGDISGSVTVVGRPPRKKSRPQIQVTFHGTSVYVESTKDLSNVVLEFENGRRYKFDGLSGPTGTFFGQGRNAGQVITTCWVKSGRNKSGDGPGYGERFDNPQTSSGNSVEPERFDDTVENVKICFGLNDVDYPYPSGSWDSFLNHCRSSYTVENAGYRKKYGGLILVDYLLEYKKNHQQTPDLWKTSHYPFHAVKEGASLFLQFLTDLDFGDEVGLISYDTYSRVEDFLDEDDAYVDLRDNPITNEYSAIDTIQRHKQAGHYYSTTAMGYGLRDARELLLGDPDDPNDNGAARFGARPTIIVMTDGQTNQAPNGWGLPTGWDWNAWTDYDGDGHADYSTSNTNKQYAFWEAVQAIESGVTIHTMSVGVNADRNLMKAIAFAGGGIWMDVPGGSTVLEMEAQLQSAFKQIAAKVPPAKLIYDDQINP